MTPEKIVENHKKYVLQSWSKQGNLNPIPVAKADGIYFYDFDGNRYTDMSSQLVNLNLGYGNKAIGDAIKEQVDKFCFVGPSYATEAKSTLAEMIINLLPDSFGKVFFTNAGADANENAVKIARMFTGRNKVFSRYRSYHGSSFGAGNLTGEPRRYPLEPGIPGFVKFFDPYVYREAINFESEEEATKFYLTKLREQIIYEGPDSVAAIVMETITGSNGVIIPPKGYLPGVRKICDDNGILMIADEVQCGNCRTGKYYASEYWAEAGAAPDIITTAKSLGAGLPISAITARAEIMDAAPAGTIGGTFCGNPVAAAAALAVMDVMKRDDYAAKARHIGETVMKRYKELQDKYDVIGDVRGLGAMVGIEFVKDRETKEPATKLVADLIQNAIQKGLLLESCGTASNTVRFLAPLTMTDEQMEKGLEIFEEALKEALEA